MNPSRITSATRGAVVAALICSTFLAASISSAQPKGYTKSEIASLPKGCHLTQSFLQPNARHAYEEQVIRYGPGWTHLHHYCYALVSIMRYDRFDVSPGERRSHAMRALADLDYVLDRVQPDFVLWPEIVARKTRLLIRERDLEAAMESAQEMLTAMPDRADSYALVAEVQLQAAKRADAKKTLDEAQSKVKDPDRLKTFRSVLKL